MISQDADFTGSGNHVDADRAKDQPFGHSDIGVARSDDFKDRGNAFRSVSGRRNALSPADLVDFRSTGDVSRCQDVRIDRSVFGRRRKDGNGRDAGDVSRNGIHENRRRIGCRAAGYIDADSLNRRKLSAQTDTGTEGIEPGLFHLPFMISPDIGRSFFKDAHKIRTDGGDSLFYFFGRDQEIVDVDAIKLFCIGTNSGVAALFDIG